MADTLPGSTIVDRYLELGLRLGRHVDGFVDAYYGPPALASRADAEHVLAPAQLSADAAELIADLDAAVDADTLDASRRRWLRAQVVGLHTSARKLAGLSVNWLTRHRRFELRAKRVSYRPRSILR